MVFESGKYIINRFRFKILSKSVNIRFSISSKLFFQTQANYLIAQLRNHGLNNIVNDLLGILSPDYKENEQKIYYDFTSELNNPEYYNLGIDCIPNFIKKNYIKFQLIEYFKLHSFIIEPFPTGVDLSIHKFIKSFNEDWDVFHKYDLVIFLSESEISVSVGSLETLISRNIDVLNADLDSIKAIDLTDGFVKRKKYIHDLSKTKLIANTWIRNQIGIKNKIQKKFYEHSYNLIKDFYNFLLINLITDLKFESGGFKTIYSGDIDQVEHEKNLMLFAKGYTDVNAATGMRDGGAYEIPKDKAEKVKFVFIFQNKEQANSLYLSFKRGLKHFPGLLSYVGIQVNIANERLNYQSRDSLIKDFEAFLKSDLSKNFYEDYFAVVLVPFSREKASIEDSKTYYLIKERLLKKGIPTQFIDSEKINSASFHYHLPNISIAILAKIGGVPWKLKAKPYNDLIVGFNEIKYGEEAVIGSAVYFDNSGRLQQIKTFKSPRRNDLIISLKDSITQFIKSNLNPPDRLIIHYYKPPRQRDVANIHRLIREEFRFSLPFAIVEINDSKEKSDLCFDVENSYGMPVSGTYIQLKKNEYLLFNNLRYWKNPIRPITVEEYPLKIKLYNGGSGGFSNRELLSQVYEFSRLYWKGLKQRSQPVTTLYSKLIADFAFHFDNREIPENDISQKTAWFI